MQPQGVPIVALALGLHVYLSAKYSASYYSEMAARDLLPGEHALLALLTLQPMHGYDLARYFAEDLAEACPVEQSLLYSYIRNLESRALVVWTEERVGNRPPRKVYRLTPAGDRVVRAWLRRPVHRMREVRREFLVKLYVVHQLDPSAEATLVSDQLAELETYRSRAASEAAAREGFPALVAASRLSAAEATITWLRDYQASLGAPA